MKTKVRAFIFTFVIGVLGYGLTTAQTPKVTSQWESSFNKAIGKNAVYQHFLGEEQNSFYVMIKKKSGSRFNRTSNYSISKWKNNFQHEKTVALQGELDIRNVYFIKNETYVLALEGKAKNRSVGFFKFNKSKMTLESVSSYFSDINLNHFDQLYFSPDSSKILLRTSPQINLNEKEKYLLAVYDSDFNKLWQKEVITPFQRAEFVGNNNRQEFAIDNSGNVFLSGRIYKEALTKKSKEKEIAYDYAILKVTQEGENKQLILKERGLFYNKCFLGIGKNDQLFAIGFFSDKSDLEKTGAYYLTVNNEFTEVNGVTLKDFPLKYLTYNKNNKYSKAVIKDIEKGIYTRYKDFVFNTALFDSNGDILLGAEEIMVYSVSKQTEYGVTYRTDRLYYDAYLFKINANGEFAWLHRIPKFQWAMDNDAVTSTIDLYQADRWSYQAFLKNDYVVVLYNDRPQNLKIGDDAIKGVKVSQVTKCPAINITIDNKGNATKTLAPGLSVDDLKLQTEFGKFERISNNRGFVTARVKTDSKMGIITVK